METSEDKGIFQKLENFFKDQIYQQKNEQSEIQNFAVSLTKTTKSSKHFERDKVSKRI